MELPELNGRTVMFTAGLDSRTIEDLKVNLNLSEEVTTLSDDDGYYVNDGGHSTPILSFEGYRSEDQLILKLNITQLSGEKIVRENGNNVFASTNVSMKEGSYLYQCSRKFTKLVRNESKLLNYSMNNTPLVLKKGYALVTIGNVIPAKGKNRQDSYAITSFESTALWELKASAGGVNNQEKEDLANMMGLGKAPSSEKSAPAPTPANTAEFGF